MVGEHSTSHPPASKTVNDLFSVVLPFLYHSHFHSARINSSRDLCLRRGDAGKTIRKTSTTNVDKFREKT